MYHIQLTIKLNSSTHNVPLMELGFPGHFVIMVIRLNHITYIYIHTSIVSESVMLIACSTVVALINAFATICL